VAPVAAKSLEGKPLAHSTETELVIDEESMSPQELQPSLKVLPHLPGSALADLGLQQIHFQVPLQELQ